MDVDDLVDAALVGLDKGEVVTIPPLADERQWMAYNEARLAMAPNLSRHEVADRYRQTVAASSMLLGVPDWTERSANPP